LAIDADADVVSSFIPVREKRRSMRTSSPNPFLTQVLYDELRRVAHLQLRRERTGHTLGTTALVHEAYLKLVDQTGATFANRAQFLGTAAVVMRRVLVDHARAHATAKRGGGQAALSLDDELVIDAAHPEPLIELDEALVRLAAFDERLARVVECRFFGGLTEEETAAAIGTTARTVRRDWVKAKGWLYDALHS
jgi:RNA polymerase sigma factor (TIGR02999 family)